MSHIKLMIDHNFGKPVADQLNTIGPIKAATTLEYGFPQNADDEDIIASTEEHNCLLLTHDFNSINETKYPPCTHGGIIIFKHKQWFPETVREAVNALCLSGRRKEAEHSVTYLFSDRAIMHRHSEPFYLEVRF